MLPGGRGLAARPVTKSRGRSRTSVDAAGVRLSRSANSLSPYHHPVSWGLLPIRVTRWRDAVIRMARHLED